MLSRFKMNLDAVGVFASTLCMIHCLAFPLLIVALPFLPEIMGNAGAAGAAEANATVHCCSSPLDSWFHVGLLVVIAPIGMLAWTAGWRTHGDCGVVWLGGLGILLLIAALLFGSDLFEGHGEQVLTVSGSLCMVSAHLWNRRRCGCCNATDPSHYGSC